MNVIEINGFGDLQQAVRQTVVAAIDRGARVQRWVDVDFAHWPLDDRELHDALAGWLRLPGRQLQLLASDYEALARAHPRFSQWRTPWMHAIDARSPTETPPADLPSLLLDDGPLVLELWERDPPRGRAGLDARAAHAARERSDARWQQAAAAWPVRTLGL